MHVASVFRIQVYLPDKLLVSFPNQNNTSQGLTGSRTVYYQWNVHWVLLKNNLWECSSADYRHTHPPCTAARGHSGFSHQGHDSPTPEAAPAAHLLWPPLEWHKTPSYRAAKSLFPATIVSAGARCFCKYANVLSEHHYKGHVCYWWQAKGILNAKLSSDHSGIKRSLKSTPKSQGTQCYSST